MSRLCVMSHLMNGYVRLNGFACESVSDVGGVSVPLLVKRDGKRVAVGLRSGLLDGSWDKHTLNALSPRSGATVKTLNEYILRRNLPDEHQFICTLF